MTLSRFIDELPLFKGFPRVMSKIFALKWRRSGLAIFRESDRPVLCVFSAGVWTKDKTNNPAIERIEQLVCAEKATIDLHFENKLRAARAFNVEVTESADC